MDKKKMPLVCPKCGKWSEHWLETMAPTRRLITCWHKIGTPEQTECFIEIKREPLPPPPTDQTT